MRYIVVTDLDGTLLDHHNYEFEAALGAISALQQHNIPLILNSSKTQAEIATIRQKLDNEEPFVCENGGILCITKSKVEGLQNNSELDIKYLGIPRQKFLPQLASIKQQLQLNYQGFAEATIEDVVQWTDLSPQDAAQAMAREATEPLLWQDSESAFERLQQELDKLQLQCVRGGRFSHVMGTFNKASCFPYLKTHYSQRWQEEVGIVALGDSQNDLPMLEAADFAVVIPSAKGTILEPKNPQIFYAPKLAPDGWQEGIDFCFKNVF